MQPAEPRRRVGILGASGSRVRWLPVMSACIALRLCGLTATPAAAEFPFVYRAGFLWVKVSVPGHPEGLNCLFDTGSAASVLNLSVVRSLGLPTGRDVKVRGVRGETTGYWLALPWAKLDEMALAPDFLAIDLGKVSDACDAGVDGLVGADFLRGRVVQIDFQDRQIRVLNPGAVPVEGEVLPLKIGPNGIRVPLRVNDGAVRWVRLDTGCASALHWVTSRLRLPSRLTGTDVALTGPKQPAGRASVRLGALNFEDVPIRLHGEEIFPGESGLLGNGLLSQFSTVTIDARSNRLILKALPASP
jgi:hypothetical protein